MHACFVTTLVITVSSKAGKYKGIPTPDEVFPYKAPILRDI